MNKSLLIVLNGASSSGKTTTAQALVSVLGDSTVHTGLDDILDRTKPFGAETTSALGVMRRTAQIMWFGMHNGRLRLFMQLHREVVELVQNGQHVIVDTALMDERALDDAAHCFAPLGGFFIGMKPPLAVSEKWELARTDRPPGQARKHYDLVHAHGTYDLVIDTSTLTPSECAQSILNYVSHARPIAFQKLSVAAGE